MNIDRDPQVGDTFRWGASGPTRTVTAVGRKWFLYTVEGDELAERNEDFRCAATLVPPRPKIADHWGYIFNRRFHPLPVCTVDEFRALYPGLAAHLAQIVDGRVCDEQGEPLEVEK